MKNKIPYQIVITFFLIILTNISFSQTSQPLSAEEQNQILKAITEKLCTVKNLKAEFKQSRHMEILIDPLVSWGYCYFKKPDKLRWELTKPYKSILIYNTNKVAKFDVKERKVEKLNLGVEDLMREILKQIISWMQGDFTMAAKIYDLKVYKSETYKLVLIPKSKELIKSIQSIEMTFNKNLESISIVKINESAENYIKIEFFNDQNNISLDNKVFDTDKPLIKSKP